ncbi:uncharacterized protein SOCE26_099860 [Sorangium cellulosum]|uniref:Uncharacterized protein n=1 Tax=Sorangium cellulosum TaxID=56 RepID=A0A2L0FAF6_SORCE|nr:uncharacterized protein SOCE26_099860 [Sorangium cellulosum]
MPARLEARTGASPEEGRSGRSAAPSPRRRARSRPRRRTTCCAVIPRGNLDQRSVVSRGGTSARPATSRTWPPSSVKIVSAPPAPPYSARASSGVARGNETRTRTFSPVSLRSPVSPRPSNRTHGSAPAPPPSARTSAGRAGLGTTPGLCGLPAASPGAAITAAPSPCALLSSMPSRAPAARARTDSPTRCTNAVSRAHAPSGKLATMSTRRQPTHDRHGHFDQLDLIVYLPDCAAQQNHGPGAIATIANGQAR